MSFSSPAPKIKDIPPPVQRADVVDSSIINRRRLSARSGITRSFFGGSAGEPGTVGKLGLTGS